MTSQMATTSAAEALCPNSTTLDPGQGLVYANCTEHAPTSHDGLKLLNHKDIWTAAVIQRVVMLTVIMLMTLVGNVAIVLVLTCSRYRKLNSRVNVFIVNLAIGDLSVFLFTMTTELLFVVFEGAWVVGAAACKISRLSRLINTLGA